MRSFNTSACLSALIAGLVLMPGIAAAQEAIKPSGGWQVTRMEQQRSGPFCALTQNYANNMIVTLGRNMTEEYSLAVDFQKNRLDPDRSYTVSLRPGPGQTRSMELMPISERAIVMRLGWDESFFEALNVSQTLGFEVDGERFNFTLPEIRSGQQDLKACIDGIKDSVPTKADVLTAQAGRAAKGFDAKRADAAAPAEVKTSMTALPEENVETPRAIPPGGDALAAQNPALQKQIASLREENKNLTARLSEEKAKFDEAFRNSAQSNEAQELREKIKLLEQENESLKAAPKPALKPEQVAGSDEALEKMRARFEESETEISRLGQMLQQERKEKAEIQEKLVKAEAKAPKQAKGAPDPEKLQKTLIERTSELERVRKELNDQKKETKSKEEQIAALQKDAKAGDNKSQSDVLNKQLADVKKERDEALKQVAILQNAQDSLETKLVHLEKEQRQGSAVDASELSSLKSRLENVTAQLKAQEDENSKMKTEMAALQSKAASRSSRIASAASPVTSKVAAAPRAIQTPAEKPARAEQAAKQPVQPTFGQRGLQMALQQSGLGVSNVSSAGASGNAQSFKWKTAAGLSGAADIRPVGDMNNFSSMVDQYIAAQKTRCSGDFAAVPSAQAAGRAQYELACVGGAGEFASSLLFVVKEGQFVSIAHNSAPQNMNSVMDARDRVATSLQ